MAQEPADFHPRWSEHFDAHHLDALMTLYDPEAVLVVEPGRVVSGHPAIREALESLRQIVLSLQLAPAKVLRSGDVAILHADYHLAGKDATGAPFEATGTTADVLRRQPGGDWLMVIDNPFGGGC